MFKLFGGGMAELTLTDDDTLNAGVVLMARPPGKRIHLFHNYLVEKRR